MSRRADRVTAVATAVVTSVLLGFIVLPILAIFLRVPPSELLAQLHSPTSLAALKVSLRSAGIAVAAIVLLGTPTAYMLGTKQFRGQRVVTMLIELPLVLPPAVAGIGLLAAFGRRGLLGGTFRAFGLELPFTQTAVVMALVFVAMPFYTRQAVAAFASIDHKLLGASRTLGKGSTATFFRIALPLARQGLSAGVALAWARALGEFGATILFAGSLQGTTQTLPLAIYNEFSAGNFQGALAISALLVLMSVAVLIGVQLLIPTHQKVGPEPQSAASK